MTALSLRGMRKRYAGGAPVLDGIDLELVSGEFFTLLGPSGCGKTTLLRIIAGFLSQDSGEVRFAGTRIDTLPPHRRDIGMVFQDYAIFPHLTVAQNVAFGLKARNLPAGEIATRVEEGLRTVRLAGFGERLPSALSGGQQQRVGLARAMAIRPRLLLMDEPLSNLDAKLRVELREDIRDIQQTLGITTVYVTHDQEEALAVSDRICVMNAGRVEQVDTPYAVYCQPARRFAAGFIGTMNFLPGRLDAEGQLHLGGSSWPLPGAAAGEVEVAIRPESVQLDGSDTAGAALELPGTIRKTVYLGREAQHSVQTSAGELVVQVARPAPDALTAQGRGVRVRLPIADLALFRPDGARVAFNA
jgi:ABC-type Fe3+/spermidine/putrescine transport system ATPase subunit